MHCAPKLSRIVIQHTLHNQNQADGESINSYIAALYKATIHCKFWDLEEVLLDRLVCGMRDIKLQRHLLTNSDLTLQQAIDDARATETTEQFILKIYKLKIDIIAEAQMIVIH